MQVSWDPETPPQGGGVTYRVSYAPVLANVILMRACMKEVVTTEAAVSSTLLSGLEPNLFYSVMVEVIIQNSLPTDSGKCIHACCMHPCSHEIFSLCGNVTILHNMQYSLGIHNLVWSTCMHIVALCAPLPFSQSGRILVPPLVINSGL